MSAGNNLPTGTEVLFFALQIVQRAETAAEAKVWAQEVLRFSGGSTEADVYTHGQTRWPQPEIRCFPPSAKLSTRAAQGS